MRQLSLDELDEVRSSFDEAVCNTAGIDHFCSSTDWIVPAARALMPQRAAQIWAAPDAYIALMRGRHPEGFSYLEPLEAMWGLACPVVGRDEATLVEGVTAMCSQPLEEWSILVMAGLARDQSLFVSLVSALGPRWRLGLGQPAQRLIVDLREGVDAFLARKSRSFRRTLQRAERGLRETGVRIVAAGESDPEALYARIMAVEARSWKGLEGAGITEGGMHDFYELMLPRLFERGAHRVLFATRDGEDLAYIFGGVRGTGYRGLQFSYAAEHRALGLGNALQLQQMRLLCEEGIESYDLGMDMEYKRRWADYQRETVSLLVLRNQ
jgi:hypothetical protein